MRLFLFAVLLVASLTSWADCPPILDLQSRQLHSDKIFDLCRASQDRVVLVVNTASQCGYTPQFRQLESLYQRYRQRGLLVVAFPSDDFRQEYQDETRTAQVCFVNYGVTFPVLAPGPVTGNQANPLFQGRAASLGEPDWNFNKYLVDRRGKPVARWRSSAAPLAGELEAAVREALAP